LVETTGANIESVLHQPPTTNPYYYFVAAYNAGGETTRVAETNNSVATIACAANLAPSDKKIVSVNGSSYTLGDSIKVGDKLTFEVTLDNSAGEGVAANITITDNMINLVKPSTGWNADYSNAAVTPSVSGTAPNQTLTFNLANSIYNVPAGAIRILTFDAEVAIAASFNGSTSRLQNFASISYNNGSSQVNKSVTTPLYSLP